MAFKICERADIHFTDKQILQAMCKHIVDKNSSGDEIANVNFLRRYGTYVLQNTKKREPTSFNQLDDS